MVYEVILKQGLPLTESLVEGLANDLAAAFPEMKGFSPTNVWRMRSFYLAWAGVILAQLVQELPC